MHMPHHVELSATPRRTTGHSTQSCLPLHAELLATAVQEVGGQLRGSVGGRGPRHEVAQVEALAKDPVIGRWAPPRAGVLDLVLGVGDEAAKKGASRRTVCISVVEKDPRVCVFTSALR